MRRPSTINTIDNLYARYIWLSVVMMQSVQDEMKGREWTVVVYRETERGWQQLVPRESRAGRQAVTTTASVRPGCLVLRRIQVRIQLSAGVVVARRQHKLLIAARRSGLRLMLLRFATLQDCLDFSDLLVALNPPVIVTDLQNRDRQSRTANMEPSSRDVISYAAQLLCDHAFTALVAHLEGCLLGSDDGRTILQSLSDTTGFSPYPRDIHG